MVKDEIKKTESIKQRWTKLNTDKFAILERNRECAKLTIPSMLPPEGWNENMKFDTPWQGLGARGVNNLASKLLIALLPPNATFFRLTLDEITLSQLTDPGQKATVDAGLAKIERSVMGWMEANAIRVSCFEALKLLIVTGNALLYLPPEGGMKVFKLDQYCIKRDPMGNVLEIVIKEKVNPIVLPPEIQEKVKATAKNNRNETIDLYTRIIRTKDGWETSQEVQDTIIPESQGTYPLDKTPWVALRWSAGSGEDYGRGLIEEYLGDLKTLEALTKAIVEFSAAAAKILIFVNPNGTTRFSKVANAESGAVVEGNKNDVTVLQLEKYADFQVAESTANKIEQRLSRAFMLVESVQRDAERVTAEEIRQMVKELEDSLGGVYSVLSLEMQLPIVRRVMAQLTSQGRLPALPKGIVQPVIVTGLEALGRGNDLNRLLTFINSITNLANAPQELNKGNIITQIATALNIPTEGLIYSPQDLQEQLQQQQMMAMVGSAVPGVATELTKGAVQNNAQNQEAA
jgi:hypothetical protein